MKNSKTIFCSAMFFLFLTLETIFWMGYSIVERYKSFGYSLFITSFVLNIFIYSITFLFMVGMIWMILHRASAFLHIITWLNEKPKRAWLCIGTALGVVFILFVWIASLRLFSSLGDSYSNLLAVIAFARMMRLLFNWEWLIVIVVEVLIGLLILTRSTLWQGMNLDQTKHTPLILKVFVGLSSVGLCFIGVLQAAPFWFFQNQRHAERFLHEQLYQESRFWLWGGVIVLNLIAAFFLNIKYKEHFTRWHWVPFIVSILFSCVLLTRFAHIQTPLGFDYHWDVFYRSNDSTGYMSYQWGQVNSRPPVYPIFIQWIAGENAQNFLADVSWNEPTRQLDNPLLNVVRYQKVLLVISFLVAVVLIMGFLRSPLPAMIFLALYDTAFYTDFCGHLLTEAITNAWLFFILAAFFGFAWKKRGFYLVLMSLGCAGIYLTRPSGVFCGIFLAVAMGWALLTHFRRYWIPSVVSVILAGSLVFTPTMVDYLLTGTLMPTPTFALQIVAFAVEVAQPADMQFMQDEESKRFLTLVLEKKVIEDEEAKKLYPDIQDEHTSIMRLRYRIANHKFRMAIGPTAAQEALGAQADTIQISAFMQKVSQNLLYHHLGDYLAIGWKQFMYAMNVLSRITTPWGFGVVLAIFVGLCISVRGWVSLTCFTMVAAHLCQVFIAGMFDIPTYRYIFATEFLLVLALGIFAIDFYNRVIFRFKSCR